MGILSDYADPDFEVDSPVLAYFLAQKSLSVEPRWRIKQTLPE
jgi:hypothetical protein